MRMVVFALLAAILAATASPDVLIAQDKKPAKDTKDEKPTEKKEPTLTKDGRVDWGNYVDMPQRLLAEVDSLTDDRLKIKITTPPLRRGMQPTVKEYTYTFHESGLVRFAKVPPKLNDKGKKVSYTEKEMTALRKPVGSPGYAGERADLVSGRIVELTILRPKLGKPADLIDSDYRIKYAIIQGEPQPRSPSETPAEKMPEKDKEKDKDKSKPKPAEPKTPPPGKPAP